MERTSADCAHTFMAEKESKTAINILTNKRKQEIDMRETSKYKIKICHSLFIRAKRLIKIISKNTNIATRYFPIQKRLFLNAEKLFFCYTIIYEEIIIFNSSYFFICL